MNFLKRKGLQISIFLILIASIAVFLYIWMLNGLKVNAVTMTSDSSDKIYAKLVENSHEHGVFKDVALDKKFVSYAFDLKTLSDRTFTETIGDRLGQKEYQIDPEVSVDMEAVRTYYKEQNQTADQPKDAYIGKKGVKKEVPGTVVDIHALLKAIRKGKTGIDESDYYVQPSITASYLQKKLDKYETMKNWSITYTSGIEITVPEEGAISISSNGSIEIDNSFIHRVTATMGGPYGSFEPITFQTHSGAQKTLTYGTWGTFVDSAAEAEAATKLWKQGKSETDRVPVCVGDGITELKSTDTYIEVSISEQMVYVHKDGNIIMSSSVVTGRSGADTPKGAYFISERVPGKYLVGEGYRSWVNRWMRLTGNGVGFHDASWRRSFGGSIHYRSGSHGCVNLPSGFAYSLYEQTYIGMPVMIY